ncbi:MAG: M67 family metallopeptidase [Chitinophagaceae bacterium]|nr:M67 family metallopeptidase [Chitinophagaceae bacterium]
MITIENQAEKIMNDDAVKAFPDECCGFMFGYEDAAGNRVVTGALPINNSAVENRKRRFEIAPKDYMKGERYAAENDVQFLGIYHSHPNHPAIPSEHDRVAAQPYFSYVIISVKEGVIDHARSWVLNENFQFDEEAYNNQLTNTNK